MTGPEHHRLLERLYAEAPVTRWFGSSIEIGDGRATVTIPVRQEFFHGGGGVHGSIYFRALDDAAFFAVNSIVEDVLVLTVSFNLYFTRPVSAGLLRAEGRLVHSSARLFVAESVLYDSGDREIARGSGTFMRSRIPLSSMDAPEKQS
jgi:uncharacterized protein (TIGR00369 family)